MGAYMQAGIISNIHVIGKNEFNVIKNKDNIINELSKTIDLSNYSIVDYKNNCFDIKLDINYFNNNIHDFIKEIYKFMYLNDYLFFNLYEDYENIDMENFNQKNYPLKLDYGKTYNKNYLYINDRLEEITCYGNYLLLIKNLKEFYNNIILQVSYIPLWTDVGKVVDYPIKTIDILNKLSKYCIKHEFGKILFFFVD